MIHLYTGEGKGKTTAAIGLAVRAAGHGLPVVFSQFMKGNASGELAVLEQIPGISICRIPIHYGFYRNLNETQKKELTDMHNQILDVLLHAVSQHTAKVLVLDEITYPLHYRLLEEEKLNDLLKQVEALGEAGPEVILTGRNAPLCLSEKADYITEMRLVRHPYQKGITARLGIEF